jgi:hypothetical protein
MAKCLADFPLVNGALVCPKNGLHIMEAYWFGAPPPYRDDGEYVGICIHCKTWVAPLAPRAAIEEAEAAGALHVRRYEGHQRPRGRTDDAAVS